MPRKSNNGDGLDFDDLIQKSRELLQDSSVAAWVLFRLDQGVDHILVDEAQDTSPAQWDVIAKLTEEFSSGEGACDLQRTIFVVGIKSNPFILSRVLTPQPLTPWPRNSPGG